MEVKLIDERLKSGQLEYKHLINLPFFMGKTDCYSILRNMYKDNLGIELTNYARPNDWWLKDEVNLYLDNYKSEGFYDIDHNSVNDPKPFDVFLIAIPDPRRTNKVITNHCAVYLGEGLVIHHRMGHFSNVVQYRGALKNMTTHWIRHKDVPDFTPKQETSIDLMSLILPHKRERLMEALNERNS